MPKFEPNLPARRAHERFSHTLTEAEAARKNLVLWFSDILRRRLYLELGYTSIYAYTAEQHGFSRSRCSAYIRLAGSLAELPILHRSLAAGEMPWTKAREVVRVATPETERAWVSEAKRSSRRALEKKIAIARGRAREARGPGRDQGSLALTSLAATEEPGHKPAEANDAPPTGNGVVVRGPEVPALIRAMPEEVRLRFPALQYAEYGALVERLRKEGWKDPVEDLVVAGLAALLGQGRGRVAAGERPITFDETPSTVGNASTPGTGPAAKMPTSGDARSRRGPGVLGTRCSARTGVRPGHAGAAEPEPRAAGGIRVHEAPAGPPEATWRAPLRTYQVVVQQCPDCNTGAVVTGRGSKSLRAAELEAVLCDAQVHRPGKRNRATIPPSLRRAVLERDGHRCCVAGCGSSRFLAVHHRSPRAAGGANTMENLVTLCASCHRAIHEMGDRARERAEAHIERKCAELPSQCVPGEALPRARHRESGEASPGSPNRVPGEARLDRLFVHPGKNRRGRRTVYPGNLA